MKTYFLKWRSGETTGHCFEEFHNQMPAWQCLTEMQNKIIKHFSESEIPLKHDIEVMQFNLV